jgi:hypothetical protein
MRFLCSGSLASSVILSGQAAFPTCPNHAGVYANPAQADQRCSDASAPSPIENLLIL